MFFRKRCQIGRHISLMKALHTDASKGRYVEGAAVADDKHFRVDSDVRSMVVCGHHVWLGHHDGDISIRKTQTTELVRQFTPTGGRVWSLVTVAYEGGDEHVWAGLSNGDIDVYSSQSLERVAQLHRHTGGIYCMAEYNGYVLSGSNDFTICVWSAQRFRLVKQFCGHSSYVRCLYADGALAISGSDDHTIRVWQVPSGAVLHEARHHHAGVSALCRVGMHIWSGDDMGVVCVWALGTYELLQRHDKAHASRITVLKKVGSRVYIGSTDRRVSIWDAYGKRQLRVLEDHAGWITTMGCPAELSRYFVWSAGAEGSVRCWHHDEYRVMNGGAERFDDVRWCYTTTMPTSEQATALIDQLHTTETQLAHWKAEAEARRADAVQCGSELESLRKRVLEQDALLCSLKARLHDAETLVAVRGTALDAAQSELKLLSEKSVALTADSSSTRVALESAKAQTSEALRKAEMCMAEKAAAEALLAKVRDVKTSECKGLPLLVINSGADEGSAVLALHQDVRSLLQLNEMLRDEVERYKGVLGIHTKTPYPILQLTKVAEEKSTALPPPIPIVQPPAATVAAPPLSGAAGTAASSASAAVASLSPPPPATPIASAAVVQPPSKLPSPLLAPAAAAVSGAPSAAPKTLVPMPPPLAAPSTTGAPAVSAASVGTNTSPAVVPSVPLFAVSPAAGGTPYEILHGGAQWLNPSVSAYVQDRYRRHVTPLFGPPPSAASPSTTPQRSVSPRAHANSYVRPATGRAFGSSTARKHF